MELQRDNYAAELQRLCLSHQQLEDSKQGLQTELERAMSENTELADSNKNLRNDPAQKDQAIVELRQQLQALQDQDTEKIRQDPAKLREVSS